jgi:hypothetical protein
MKLLRSHNSNLLGAQIELAKTSIRMTDTDPVSSGISTIWPIVPDPLEGISDRR